jgi:hypothetical protein
MRVRFLASLVAALSAASSALAQSGESLEAIEIPCVEAPSDAKTQLPPILAEWAVVSCTRFGHVVRAAPGWVWHNPRTNEFVRVWSQPSTANLEPTGQADHFTYLEFKQLSPQEADEANAALAEQLGAKPQVVADAYVLLLRDVRGQAQAVHFVRTDANLKLGNLWGWACGYPCVKPQVFMAFKPRK